MVQIKVSDMSCQHCVEKITKGLIVKGIRCKINLPEKNVEVADKDYLTAKATIIELGYTVIQ